MSAAASRKSQSAATSVPSSPNTGLLKFNFERMHDYQVQREQPKSRGIRDRIIRWLNEQL
jgi:hypothetical protein